MGDFVNCRLDCLYLGHSFIDSDTLFISAEISFCTAVYLLKADRDGRYLFQSRKEFLKVLNIACQLICSERWQFLAVGLTDIKYADNLKRRDFYINFLGNRLSVLIKNRELCNFIKFRLFLLNCSEIMS